MINMWEIYIKSMNIEIKDYLMLIHVQFEINQFVVSEMIVQS